MGDSFIISGLRRKHAEILGSIAALEREADQLRADLERFSLEFGKHLASG
jgi:hypothetical protein